MDDLIDYFDGLHVKGSKLRTRSLAEDEMLAQFGQFYGESLLPVNMRVERDVCGCTFGGVSWATRWQIDRIGAMLDLGPGDQLMDLGAGSGWPGLYLAEASGCDVTLLDLPHEGLVIAAERAKTDGLTGACIAAVADGESLPCRNNAFDALTHSDVLCCLPGKINVLEECRRVLHLEGQMVFSVIYIVPGLNRGDHGKAVEAGPPYIDTATTYDDLLSQTGWATKEKIDLTAEYLASVKTFYRSTLENKQEFIGVYGEETFNLRMSREPEILNCLEEGHIKRALYQVTPA
jgi:ubiquinone/menaquinone biosynthesis C-methylase UbiE